MRILANAPISRGGAWSNEGTILFAPSSTGPLYRVPAAGGMAVEATHIQPPRQTGHRYPHFLPDGRHFLFFAVGTPENQGVYLGSLDSTDSRRLLEAGSAATFTPPNYLLFARQGTLLAQRLDLGKLEPADDPLPVAARVAARPGNIALAALSSSSGADGVSLGCEERDNSCGWTDRADRPARWAVPMRLNRPKSGSHPTDALWRSAAWGNTDVWLIEMARGVVRRFTSETAASTTRSGHPMEAGSCLPQIEVAVLTISTKNQSMVPGPRRCCWRLTSSRTPATGLRMGASSFL